MFRNKTVQPLDESFKELGLDPDKMIGSMERNSQLVEDRSVNRRDNSPPVTTYGDPAHVADQDLVVDEARRVKTARGSEAKRARRKAKIAYKKTRGKRKTAAKKYRKTAAAKKQRKRHARLLKRLGGPKKGMRIFTADTNLPDNISGLREDLNQSLSHDADATAISSFEEAALNASLLCAMLSDVFESLGDEESAHTMLEVSNSGTSLSDSLADVESEDDLSEEYTQAFEELIGATVKALRFWEGLGGPSINEAIKYGEGLRAAN
jgi:hypothetical protein